MVMFGLGFSGAFPRQFDGLVSTISMGAPYVGLAVGVVLARWIWTW
jgi:hypothetical protein